MDIRELIYFVQIAKERTYSAAAKKLYISQPALSKAIKNLEDELSVKLFIVVDKHNELTDAGEILYKKAEHLIDEYNSILDAINEVSTLKKGRMRIGIPYGLGKILLYGLISEFSNHFPEVEITISGNGSNIVKKGVLSGQIDIGVTITPPEVDLKFNTAVIGSDQYFLLVNKENRLANHESVSFAELKNEDFLMLNDEYIMTEITKQNCITTGFSPHIKMTLNRTDIITQMVEENNGIAIIAGGKNRFLSNPKLSCVPLADGVQKFNIVLITKKDAYLPFAARKFIEFAQLQMKAASS
ncbi:MAG: LysR family transcriptional regulator [Firmicutes bacterium]|nr:LysR family transcriptional regulator [Bacillota bacterium]